MTPLRLRYVQAWVDSEGRPHHYFRRPGYKRVPLPGMPGSLEFMQAYQAAVAQKAKPVGIKRSKPGSVAAAIASFLDSTLHFASRAAGTQAMQRAILERFREQCGDYPIALMPPKFIAALLAKKKPHAARIMSDAMFYDTMQLAIALAIMLIALAVGRYFNRHFQ